MKALWEKADVEKYLPIILETMIHVFFDYTINEWYLRTP